MEINDKIAENLLKQYKPIIVIYLPIEIYKEKNNPTIEILKEKFKSEFKDTYLFIFIPSVEDDIRLDVLSVLKSKIIKDTELKNYLNKISMEFQNEYYD